MSDAIASAATRHGPAASGVARLAVRRSVMTATTSVRREPSVPASHTPTISAPSAGPRGSDVAEAVQNITSTVLEAAPVSLAAHGHDGSDTCHAGSSQLSGTTHPDSTSPAAIAACRTDAAYRRMEAVARRAAAITTVTRSVASRRVLIAIRL